MRALLDPVLERAGDGLGPLQAGGADRASASSSTTEVGVVVGYLAQRVLGQYELVLLDEAVDDQPAAAAVRAAEPRPGGARLRAPTSDEFMTWVTLHEVTHAVQFAGVPWLHGHVAGLVRELLQSAELRIETPRKLRLPSRGELRRVGARAAPRRPDLDRHQPRPSARRSTGCRR